MGDLGKHIRKTREERDFSLREFAKKLNVTATFLSDIELGKRNPSEQVLQEIAKHLDVPYESLLELDNRVPIKELRELFDSNPKYGLAFRKLAKNRVSPEELIKLVDDREKTKD